MTLRADFTVRRGELLLRAALEAAAGETLALVGPNGAGKTTLLRTLAGLERYLGSGVFPGIGPDMAKRLVGHFGEDTLTMLERGPTALQRVPGIGPKRAQALAAGFADGIEQHRVLAELRGFGLSGPQAMELYRRHQAGAVRPHLLRYCSPH